MISRWFELKSKATSLRESGYSIRDVENELGIPRSTLSSWFKSIKLSIKHKRALKIRWDKALIKARKEALVWHNEQKRLRLEKAEEEALGIIEELDLGNKKVLELTLAMLYLGEGSKKN